MYAGSTGWGVQLFLSVVHSVSGVIDLGRLHGYGVVESWGQSIVDYSGCLVRSI